jgi:hypothetical protein
LLDLFSNSSDFLYKDEDQFRRLLTAGLHLCIIFFGDEGNAITRDLLLMAFPISKELVL